MTRTARLLLGLALPAALCAAGAPARAEEVRVVKESRYWGSVDAYRIGTTYYLAAKDAARVYDGRLYWYPVSGKVQISLRGKSVSFEAGSEQANAAGRTVRMSYPVLLRTSQAFIPADFFLAKEFAMAAGFDSTFDPKARLLSVEKRPSVGALRWSTHPAYTRLVLELDEDLRFKTQKRGVGGFDLSVLMGAIAREEGASVNDGVVESAELRQERRQVRLMVRLGPDAGPWTVKELPSPRRLVVDVTRLGAPAQPYSPPAPDADPAPEAPAPAPPPVESAEVIPGPAPSPKERERVKPRVVIDPGHGGRDSGATGRRGVHEKDINLKAGLELAKLLKEAGFEVLLTRDKDVFIPLADRSRMANEFGADVFVSLHCNAHRNRKEKGFEIYFLSEKASDPEAERLAEFENSALAFEGKDVAEEESAAKVLYALARTEFMNDAAELAGLMAKEIAARRAPFPNRGVKQAAFYVLRGANSPAVLVEMGFISNSAEEAKLKSAKDRGRLVESLRAGIMGFAGRRGWGVRP